MGLRLQWWANTSALAPIAAQVISWVPRSPTQRDVHNADATAHQLGEMLAVVASMDQNTRVAVCKSC